MKNLRNTLVVVVLMAALAGCNRPASAMLNGSATEKSTNKEAVADDKEIREGDEAKIRELDAQNDRTEAKSLYEKGIEAHNKGEFGAAEAYFSQAVGLFPELAGAWEFRGMSRFKQGKREAACSDWKTASQLGSATAAGMHAQYCGE